MKEKINLATDKRAWSLSPLLGQIVLITTLNEDGISNIAPKSWISMMAFDPPLVAIGCNLSHWTAQNILRSHEFVVNIPGAEMVDATMRTAEPEHHPDDLEHASPTAALLTATIQPTLPLHCHTLMIPPSLLLLP